MCEPIWCNIYNNSSSCFKWRNTTQPHAVFGVTAPAVFRKVRQSRRHRDTRHQLRECSEGLATTRPNTHQGPADNANDQHHDVETVGLYAEWNAVRVHQLVVPRATPADPINQTIAEQTVESTRSSSRTLKHRLGHYYPPSNENMKQILYRTRTLATAASTPPSRSGVPFPRQTRTKVPAGWTESSRVQLCWIASAGARCVRTQSAAGNHHERAHTTFRQQSPSNKVVARYQGDHGPTLDREEEHQWCVWPRLTSSPTRWNRISSFSTALTSARSSRGRRAPKPSLPAVLASTSLPYDRRKALPTSQDAIRLDIPRALRMSNDKPTTSTRRLTTSTLSSLRSSHME